MDQKEQRVIDELFGKLQQVERQSPQRDSEAEAQIRRQVSAQPAAPYYMAQVIVVQEQALANLQARVQELERQLAHAPAGGGGFLSGLFGGGQSSSPQRPAPAPRSGHASPYPGQAAMGGAPASPWGRPAGGGFLAGAMQTALGVAGGMLVADAISSAFEGGTAEAADLAQDAGFTDPGAADVAGAEDAGFDDFGGDAGGFDEPV